MPFLRINEIVLHHEVSGRGKPLVFIHGLGSSGRDWKPQVDFFSRSYQVVVFDLRGHGQSSRPPGPYSIKLFAADTAALIEALALSPAHVAGLSLGGMIAWQLAADRPELLRSMVAVNCGPEVRLKSLKHWWMALRRCVIVRLFGMRKMGEILARDLFPGTALAQVRKTFVERWAENDRKAYVETMRAIVGWSVTDRIGCMDVPTLVVASEHDYTPVSVKEAFISRMPRAELAVIENAHHAVPIEQPDRFNGVVAAFLERQRPSQELKT